MSAIKKIALTISAILALATVSYAQTYTITPGDTVEMSGTLEHLQTLIISQHNIGPDTIYLKWEKISEEVPANWEASVCDNSICYTTLRDSGMMNPIVPGDMGFLVLHITPHVGYDTSIVRYAVWNISNPMLKDTLTFILKANPLSAIDETITSQSINIFPNPANVYVNIISSVQKIFTYSITDLSGKEIQTGISNESSQVVSLKNFSNGIYNVSISDGTDIYTNRKIIVQH